MVSWTSIEYDENRAVSYDEIIFARKKNTNHILINREINIVSQFSKCLTLKVNTCKPSSCMP